MILFVDGMLPSNDEWFGGIGMIKVLRYVLDVNE